MVWRAGRNGKFLRALFTMISAMASSIFSSSFLTVFGSIGCSSHFKPRIVSDGCHALVHRKSVEDADPFLARVPHGVKGKLFATKRFHAGKHPLERGREGILTW